MFKGSAVAIVTPFKNNKVDEKALVDLIEWHISEGTNAIVPCGTTGEASTLDYDEHYRVIEVTVQTVNKRVPVVAGTGANSTDETLTMTKKARALGADGVLLVTPYYNKPSQEGLYIHYEKVAKTVDIPVVLYNVPSRTGVNMLPKTVARLAEIENIVAIKEATGSMKQVSEVIRLCGDSITLISGDDFTTLTLMALGGKGVISVAANVAPKDVSDMCRLWNEGKIEEARKLHFKLEPVNESMFIETNPVPAKTALGMMGKIQEEFRLPLCAMSSENKEKLKKILINQGLLSS
ncbi:MAG TPA: 4-hydroxy-tetrahydrodipicolinate synthase [Nitrospirae bacterium]|nr:4-hydroxy-tetrahydrodipicolinate synthase [bacterium BMS3Abin10]GBE39264.1 4-hydroxy-tetrahydrodipicolinate synthase [bacterium BMS3Bbin08]HDH51556.1 4-hydroxy-tetrahydrodipicolinate synthase [Nitrospirota bacterium]HDK41153.1 4-hydroxy-tetrahydrodipicolinate synthase [Nitrospirota bacterium]HDK82634.1 4-hydroxy-tetrahydrodipicolinate synthase [Nitrospirota bacterium]